MRDAKNRLTTSKKMKKEITNRSEMKDKDQEAREHEVGPRVQDGGEKGSTEKNPTRRQVEEIAIIEKNIAEKVGAEAAEKAVEKTTESEVSEKEISVQVTEKDTNNELAGGKQ
jgi:hypothetical protein